MKSTRSLCPECLDVIDASIFEMNGKVVLEKTCQKHGYFKDIYWSNAKQFWRFDRYMHDGEGVKYPNVSKDGDCPKIMRIMSIPQNHYYSCKYRPYQQMQPGMSCLLFERISIRIPVRTIAFPDKGYDADAA